MSDPASQVEKPAHRRLYYGWIIFAVTSVVIFVSLGLSNSVSGLYLAPVTESLGISRAAYSLTFSIRFILTAAANLFFGLFVRKIGIRRMTTIAFLCLALCHVCFSFAQNIWMFYLGGLFLGLGSAWGSTTVAAYMVDRWFVKYKGTLTGVVLAFSGLGSSVFSLLVADWIEKYTWRGSYFISVFIFLIMALPCLIFLRSSPEEIGLRPFGEGQGKNAVSAKWSGMSLAEALRKPYFYMAGTATFFSGFVLNAIYTSATAHLEDNGFTPQSAALILSMMFLLLAASKIVAGFVYDKLGFVAMASICFLSAAVGTAALAVADRTWLAVIYAVGIALGLPLETVVVPLLATELFGPRYHATFMGIFLALSTSGIATGLPVLNAVYDATGTYRSAMLCEAGLLVLLLLLTLISHHMAQKEQKKGLRTSSE